MATTISGPSRLSCVGWSIALVAAVVLEAGTGLVLLISALLIPVGIGRWPAGGGLAGVQRRLAGFDGIVSVASPIGGPTIVTMELPCQLAFALS